MSEIQITKDNFSKEVLESEVPVLVDFWAPWCGPCQMMMPVIEEIAGSVQGIKVGKANIDEQTELAMKYRIMSIPTLAVFKGGELVQRVTGTVPKEEILDMIEKAK